MSFQVGDLVVIQNKHGSTNRLHKILRIESSSSGYFIAPIHNDLIMHMLGCIASDFYLRHATPAEIAAGHRIDTPQLEVLEMIDVSPNCEVSEL